MSSENDTGVAGNQLLHHGHGHRVEVGHQHRAIGFVVTTLGILVQLKYQQQQPDHSSLITVIIVALFVYAAAFAASARTKSKMVDMSCTLAGTLAAVCLVFMLNLVFGWILLCLWIAYFCWAAYALHQELYHHLLLCGAKSTEIAAIIRSRIGNIDQDVALPPV